MEGKVFNTIISENGLIGVQSNHNNALTVIGYRSPYGTRKHDEWLERKLLRIYTIYYSKVLFATKGRFWKDTGSQAITYAKGGTTNGSKV